MTTAYAARKKNLTKRYDGHLYVMTGPRGIKIGFSNDPERRLKEVHGVAVMHRSISFADAREVERAAHARLADRSVGNEWFQATVGMLGPHYIQTRDVYRRLQEIAKREREGRPFY